MKQKVIVLGLFISLFNIDFLLGQNPTIRSDEYKLLTQFEQINGSKDVNGAKEFMALASYKGHYALLLENVVIHDYSKKVENYDKDKTSMKLSFYKEKQGNSTIGYSDEILLIPCDIQPKSNTNGFLIAFELSNEYAFDIKGKRLADIILIEEYANSKLTTGRQHGPENAKDFFIRHQSKITSKQGSFVDVEKYKSNKITLYSLLLQKKQDIIKNMGIPNKKSISEYTPQQYLNDSVYQYENNIGIYKIVFKGDISCYIAFLPKIKIAGTDPYFLEKYLKDKYPFELENKFPQDYTIKQGSSGRGTFGNSYNSLMYYFKDDVIHKIVLTTEGRFVKKAEAYVDKDVNLLVTTKSQKELFKEKIDETIFSTMDVCRENGWDYDQSMFNKIRKRFPKIVQNENWSYACANKACSGNIQLIINWTSKKGSSSMKVTPVEIINETSYISTKLAYELEKLLSNSSRPEIDGELVSCNDTLYSKILETNITVLKSASSLKFENSSLSKDIRDYVLNNTQKLRLNDNCIIELKILDLEFEGNIYKIGLIKGSQKELNMFNLAKMKKKYIY